MCRRDCAVLPGWLLSRRFLLECLVTVGVAVDVGGRALRPATAVEEVEVELEVEVDVEALVEAVVEHQPGQSFRLRVVGWALCEGVGNRH